MSQGEPFFTDAEQWQRLVHKLWRTARGQGWTRGPLRLIVTWTTPSASEQRALIQSARAEGGTEEREEDASMDLSDSDVAMAFQVTPNLKALDGLLLRLQVLGAKHRAT